MSAAHIEQITCAAMTTRWVRRPDSTETCSSPPTAYTWYPNRVRRRASPTTSATPANRKIDTGTGPMREYPNDSQDPGTEPVGRS